MKPEYIEREAAITAIDSLLHQNFLCVPDSIVQAAATAGYMDAVKDADIRLRSIPVADARPVVRGKWRFEKGDGKTCDDGWVCSACNCGFHTHVPYFEDFRFCPNCGADMREKSCFRGERRKADI